MNENTINDDVTIGGATGTILAGRYRVVKQLGQGGMGSVWLAEDTKLDGLRVAVKMLPSILVNNRRAYAQVKAEALVSLKLTHSNIVAVRAFEEEGGNPFLVMDYIDGRTLDDYLSEREKLSEDETIRLLKPVAEALDYAHAQGVVHRDVKPGNIMIRKDGVPFVLDFGIAREVQETMTRVTGKLSSGTLMYMSPEQLHGAAPKPAQDVYSFSAMAYECLMGKTPFSRGQIEYQIEHDTPTPLGPHFMKCGRGVMAGLEKLPGNRPATCAAVLTVGAKVAQVRKSRLGLVAVCSLALVGVAAAVFLIGRASSAANSPLDGPRSPVVDEKPMSPKPPEPLPDGEGADRHRQEEIVLLTKTRTKIAIKVASAKADYAKVAPYRSERDGFEPHLAEIDRQWTLLERLQEKPRTLADAQKTLAAVTEAADAIAFELNWLATNREGRDAAKRMEKEIADGLDSPLQAFKAYDVAKSKYDKGQAERKAAADALARGEFVSSRQQFEQAKATLTAALSEARQFHIKTALEIAKEYKNAAQWRKCLEETEKVFGWDPGNAEALAIRAEATKEVIRLCEAKDWTTAFELSQKADRSHPTLQYYIGRMYDDGNGVAKDAAEAVRWYRKAAEQGYAKAQNDLAVMYEYGQGVTKDYGEAVLWYRKAAEQGNAMAQKNLGLMYEAGKGVAKDFGEAVEWYLKAADLGNVGAMCNLGVMYEFGRGVVKDFAEAVRWYRKAADRGEARAQYNLGLVYANGRGVAKDEAEAVRWFRKSAEQGYANAQNYLGTMYENGSGVEKDFVEAVGWYRKSAEKGNEYAQSNLGLMYENGRGVAKDMTEAARWYRKSAEQGNAIAQYGLARLYESGSGVEKNEAEAVLWYRKSAEQGRVQAQSSLGVMYEKGRGVSKDLAEAARWYRKAAEQGYDKAQFNLARLYENGNGVEKNEAEAVQWYRKAAEQGYVTAQYNLGVMYANGRGVVKDESEAIQWYRKAAEQGYADAQNNLGVMYGTGRGVARDAAEAVRWYRKAAENGNALAQKNLGVMYEYGQGVAKDVIEAARWYRKAAEQGNEKAKENLKRLGW